MEYELCGDRAVIIVSALVAILSSSTSVSKTTLVQRSAFAETTCTRFLATLLSEKYMKVVTIIYILLAFGKSLGIIFHGHPQKQNKASILAA